MITRRSLLAGGAALGLAVAVGSRAAAARATGDPLLPLWKAWRRMHVSSAGRVIDRLQDNISHSEGQGYALLIAQALGDRDGFELLLDWTVTNLAVRPDDALLAWRWHPGGGGAVTDANNASDGDIFAAWALLRAAETFDEPGYRARAEAMAADLARLCLLPCPESDDCLLLLPGADGFVAEAGVVVNPAYYMPRAMRELGAATGQPALVACAADGVALLARLARERLVPDWVEVGPDGYGAAEGKSAAFGYEAMRAPLYLVWSALQGHPAVARARDAYLAALDAEGDATPTVIDPAAGEVVETSDNPGYRALAALTVCADGRGSGRFMPAFAAEQPYYPGVLHLLSLLAQRETTLGCYLR